MTLVVDILGRAARQCSVSAPSSWITSANKEHVEIREDFLSDTVDDILSRADLPGPVGKTTTLTGVGSENYTLPADFKRLARDDFAIYERTTTRRRCYPVTTDGDYEYMKELGTAGAYRFYRLKGYDGARTVDFYRALETGITVVVSYVSTVWLVNSGTEKSAFTDPGDVAVLPRRLIEQGIVWRFRQRRGVEYMDAQASYEAQLARLVNDTRSRRTISFASPLDMMRHSLDVPVPDFIPPA